MMRTLAATLVMVGLCLAQEKKSPLVGPIELLWPNGAPLAQGTDEADKPNLSVYFAPPDKATGTAVLVCPGGGYGHLAKAHEGHDVAVSLNSLGISAFVLTYRHAPKYHHPCPMLDIQRAIRMVRARAAEWKVDPARIGVIGFSAGGHLASTAMTHFDEGKPESEDPVDKVGCRPDFAILIYPYIVLDKPYTHQGAKKNLLGEKFSEVALAEELSADRQVTAKAPPCFLIHASDDTVVPPDHSIELYLALRRAKVDAELHIYEKGGHGFGLAPKNPILSTWPDRLSAWMGTRGLLKKQAAR